MTPSDHDLRKSGRDAYAEATRDQFDTPEMRLGPWTSDSLMNDPKHMCFVLARYKFCAKIFEGKRTVLEVGVGDGFGLPLVAQVVGHLYALDWDRRLLDGNARRLAHLRNVSYLYADLNEAAPDVQAEGVYALDVIEHVEPAKESRFLENVLRCLKPTGVLLIGTPNVTAAEYASPRSRAGHINLKSMQTLRELVDRYFENVFMFGMNDEVVHTGYPSMCHYIWSLGVGVRSTWRRR
jgi:2-polyprenyl-3-methyl-5-hydroxy-6-metoxy-1,4-benzoquinol methylase